MKHSFHSMKHMIARRAFGTTIGVASAVSVVGACSRSSGPASTPSSTSFSTLSVEQDQEQDPGGTCTGTVGQDFSLDDCPGIRDCYDFIRYTQSTQGHLNSQGLCYIDRQYPAPAGGS